MRFTIRSGAASAILGLALVAVPSGAFVATGLGQDKIKDAATAVGDKTEDVKDKTVDVSKKVGSKTKDTAVDVKDATVKGAKATGDKAEDITDGTVKGTKATGNGVKRFFGKIGGWFHKH